jgi:hypothetical protein
VAVPVVPAHGVVGSLIVAAAGGERERGDRDDEQGIGAFHASSISLSSDVWIEASRLD